MADADTTRYALVKPEVGASADTWGGKLNQDFDDLDALLTPIATTGSANAYVLTTGLSLAAYVTGQSFWIKPNFAPTGAATINVDGLGAKDLRKNGTTALASGDLATDQYYRITYNGTQFQVTGVLSGVYQPLDATLTALAALSWSSGSPLVSFTAADTVSLTLAPSVTSVTASQGAAATTATGTFVNTTDSASVRAVRIEGDRATPANSDIVYASWILSNSTGTQFEYGRISSIITDVTASSEDGQLYFGVALSGALSNRVLLAAAAWAPITNDTLSLGFAGNAWADLFLASGAVINFANGGVTLTHDATLDGLVVAGGSLVARIPLSTETTGTLTSTSANKKILATGGITLPNSVFASEDTILIDGNGTARTITRGSGVTMYVAGVDSATATLAANGLMGVSWRTASICILSGAVS